MQSLLLSLLFFSLPFGTRVLLRGGADEYQSMFLYATDVLLGMLFLWWLLSTPLSGHKKQLQKQAFVALPSLAFIAWLTIASAHSANPLIGIYQTLKAAEFLWLFYYLTIVPEKTKMYAFGVLVASALTQSLVAMGQFFLRHDLGFRILGENILRPDIAGVAKLDLGVQKFIRAYGTFPHPNVLAAFLLLAIVALFFLYAATANKKLRSFFVASLPLLLLGLLLTFSRVAIATFIGVSFFWFFMQGIKKHAAVAVSLVTSLVLFGILLFPYFQSRAHLTLADQSLAFRLFYVKTAFVSIAEHPFVGVGPGQFTAFQRPRIVAASLPDYANQPVHTMYLLIIAETGLVGIFLFYWILHNIFYDLFTKKSWREILLYFLLPGAIFVLASFDHFFITFQQGAFTFWIALAFYMTSLTANGESRKVLREAQVLTLSKAKRKGSPTQVGGS